MAYKYSYNGQEEKKVEILTLERIKKEILKNVFSSMKIVLFMLGLMALMFILLFKVLDEYGGDLEIYFEMLLFAAFTVYFIIKTISLIGSFLKINRLKVVVDHLADLKETGYATRYGWAEEYQLFFKRFGKYIIPKANYKWSKIFSMNDRGVYNYSNPDDSFYLAIIGDKQIGMAYNAKLFKYEGNIEK